MNVIYYAVRSAIYTAKGSGFRYYDLLETRGTEMSKQVGEQCIRKYDAEKNFAFE